MKIDNNNGYHLEKNRLDSLKDNWPHPEGAKLASSNIAKAGFYYMGPADCVKCFVCQIKLRDWEENDDPWSKHETNCLFAKLKKEERLLTIDQWIDIASETAINRLDKKVKKVRSFFINNTS